MVGCPMVVWWILVSLGSPIELSFTWLMGLVGGLVSVGILGLSCSSWGKFCLFVGGWVVGCPKVVVGLSFVSLVSLDELRFTSGVRVVGGLVAVGLSSSLSGITVLTFILLLNWLMSPTELALV